MKQPIKTVQNPMNSVPSVPLRSAPTSGNTLSWPIGSNQSQVPKKGGAPVPYGKRGIPVGGVKNPLKDAALAPPVSRTPNKPVQTGGFLGRSSV